MLRCAYDGRAQRVDPERMVVVNPGSESHRHG